MRNQSPARSVPSATSDLPRATTAAGAPPTASLSATATATARGRGRGRGHCHYCYICFTLEALNSTPQTFRQCLENLPETGKWSVLALGSLYLPCNMRDTA